MGAEAAERGPAVVVVVVVVAAAAAAAAASPHTGDSSSMPAWPEGPTSRTPAPTRAPSTKPPCSTAPLARMAPARTPATAGCATTRSPRTGCTTAPTGRTCCWRRWTGGRRRRTRRRRRGRADGLWWPSCVCCAGVRWERSVGRCAARSAAGPARLRVSCVGYWDCAPPAAVVAQLRTARRRAPARPNIE